MWGPWVLCTVQVCEEHGIDEGGLAQSWLPWNKQMEGMRQGQKVWVKVRSYRSGLEGMKQNQKVWDNVVWDVNKVQHAEMKLNNQFQVTSVKNKLNTSRRRQNGCHSTDTFNLIFLNENVRIFIKISRKFVPKILINNIQALV